MKYDVDYFIKKFTKIPAKKWTTGDYVDGNKRCALGHCGEHLSGSTDEARALNIMFLRQTALYVYCVNDGNNLYFQQQTPRARILAALRYIKKGMKQ